MANGLAYLGMGAALMYLLDPQHGRKRRNDLANRIDSARRQVERGADMVLRDATNRTHGMLLGTQKWLRAQRERVGSGGAIGPTASAGMGPAIASAKNMVAPWQRDRWSPAQRALAGIFGAGLATSGYVRGGLLGVAMSVAGVGLIARATANERIGALAHGKGFTVDRMIVIDAPVERVFAFWRDSENMARWMSHVREVRNLGGERYRWVVDGPAGAPVEWTSELTGMRENRELAWRSVEGSTVDNSGRVRFEPAAEGTRVHIELHYAPPGGVIGHAVAKAFGVDPASDMDDDLPKLRGLIASDVGTPAPTQRPTGGDGLGAAPA